jgi:RNA-directed DNA polymerase
VNKSMSCFESLHQQMAQARRKVCQIVGGVISPILMNLFMHYAFDCWMQRRHPQCPYARYAYDAVVHCRSRKQAEDVMQAIAARLKECGLTMHPEKSKGVYCKDSNRTEPYPHVSFTFLGFTFQPRRARNKRGRRFTSFLQGASQEAQKRMRQTVRGWHWHQQTPAKLDDLARQCNPTIRGWWNYYGAFYQTVMHKLFAYMGRKLAQWARRKYKALRRHKRRSTEWLGKMKQVFPRMFFHWNIVGGAVG